MSIQTDSLLVQLTQRVQKLEDELAQLKREQAERDDVPRGTNNQPNKRRS